MNIIRRELKANLRSLLIWSGVTVVVLLFASTELDAFQQSSSIQDMMDSLPEGLAAMFGLDVIRMDTPEGYLSYFGQFLALAAALFGGLAGTQVLSREIRKKTIETTFPLPITRRRLLAMKIIAALMNCIAFCGIIYAGLLATLSSRGVAPGFAGHVLAFVATMLLVQILFLFAGFAVSVVITRRHKLAGSVMGAVAIGFFLISFLSRLSDQVAFLGYLTPFDYFPVADLLHGRGVDALGFIVIPAVIAALGLLSFGLVKRKDIYT